MSFVFRPKSIIKYYRQFVFSDRRKLVLLNFNYRDRRSRYVWVCQRTVYPTHSFFTTWWRRLIFEDGWVSGWLRWRSGRWRRRKILLVILFLVGLRWNLGFLHLFRRTMTYYSCYYCYYIVRKSKEKRKGKKGRERRKGVGKDDIFGDEKSSR